MLILALLLQAAAAPCTPDPTPSSPPALVVQVVDPSWLPIPGADVRVTRHDDSRPGKVLFAGPEGYARAWSLEGEYDIEAQLPGFKKGRIKGVRLGSSTLSPTTYVQIRLQPALGEPTS